MIKVLFNKIQKFIFYYYWLFFPKKINKLNLNDLNFRKIDFVNYQKIRSYFFKDSFFKKYSSLESHSFDFLYFAKKLGGKTGIELSKKYIFQWYTLFKHKVNFPWNDELIAKRLINILYNYEFINSLSSKYETDYLNKIIYIHVKRLFYEFKKKSEFDLTSDELKAVTLFSLILNKNNLKFLKKIEAVLDVQIDALGVHKSYNLLEHAKFINNINEIKNIFLYFGIKIPDKINFLILNMTSILNQYVHDDGSIALFNGANNSYQKQIIELLSQEEFLKSRTFKNVQNGIAFYYDKKKRVFYDVVQPTKYGFSKNLSAGTLSFELSVLGEKIITNCGASENSGKNPEYLRYSAAHSTIILKNTNISEIKEKNPHLKYPQKVSFNYENINDMSIFEGSHNGYMNKYKKIIKRKLIISNNKNKVIGEDSIISLKAKDEKIVYHIRFHLMPGINTNVTNNKKNIILKTKKNKIWLFKSNSEITIENSIYVNNNTTKEIQQIVIKGITSKTKQTEKWSIEKI